MALIIPISFKENEINLYYKIKNHLLGPSTYLKLLALQDEDPNLKINLSVTNNNDNNNDKQDNSIIYKQKNHLSEEDINFKWGEEEE